jgi:hypothetical protein
METTAPAPSTQAPRTGRIIGASLIGLLALGLLAAGIAGIWTRATSTEHGYITSGSHTYAADGRAIVSGSIDADGIPDWLVAKLRVAATSEDGRPLFVGVGRRDDVDRYLAGVAHSTVEDVSFDPFEVDYTSTAGRAVPSRPAEQTFWAESHVGTGKQTVAWKMQNGNWRVVVMNADGSPHVAADASVGASIRGALAIAISATALGALLAAVAAALLIRADRRS